MLGDGIKNLEDGLAELTVALRQDPHALETVYISVIAFAGIARTIVPLVEIPSFYPPKLPLGSGTAYGLALKELMAQFDKEVVASTSETKGDWKPLVFIMTDGKPTDKYEDVVRKWNRQYAAKASVVAVGIGSFAHLAPLMEITENVFQYSGKDDADFSKYIKWISSSVSLQSKSIASTGSDNISLSKPDCNIITLKKKDDIERPIVDEDCVVIRGRCQKTRNLYLMKYDAPQNLHPFNKEVSIDEHFRLSGCYPVDESYLEWSSKDGQTSIINTDKLSGIPGCPYCGNISAFAMCGCGEIMCLGGPGKVTCPWCHATVTFELSNERGQGFNVQRGRG
jgi:uncharacterized protein YegL